MKKCITLLILICPFFVKAQKERPNVVIVVADDLGRNDLGCYGNRYIKTPNLDRIAGKSLLFSQAYAAAPVCSPTRASILTGQYPARIGITNFIDGRKTDVSSLVLPAPFINYLPYAVQTIPELLKPVGYQTALIGKWHLGENTHPDSSYPGKNGFDFVKHYDYGLIPDGNTYVWIRGVDSAGSRYRLPQITEMITADALTYLDSAHTAPFFLMVTHYNPHLPLQPKPELAAKYKAIKNPYGDDINPLYAAMVEELDQNVGALWKKLEEKGLLKSTVFLFISDNGGVVVDEAGEKRPTTSAPLRNGKGTLYEGGIRIPLLLYHPSLQKPGVSGAQVTTTDFLPTILQWCGVQQPQSTLDGESFASVINRRTFSRQKPLFWHYPHFSNQGGRPTSAVRVGNYKLIQSLEDGSLSLYDLSKDEGEKRNIASEHPEIVNRLLGQLQGWQRETKASMPIPKNSKSL